jgi:ATP phosphoribosyltransferase
VEQDGRASIIGPEGLSAPHREGIRLGVPNRGRLFARVAEVVEDALGVDIRSRGMRYQSGDVEVICARSADLPALVASRLVDVAVTGFDYVADSGLALTDVGDLELIVGSVTVLVPEAVEWEPDAIALVASQYPRLTARWWADHGRTATVVAVSGASEIYPLLGVVDAVVDVYASGETALLNGLRPVEWIMPTSGRLFVREGEDDPRALALAEQLLAARRRQAADV